MGKDSTTNRIGAPVRSAVESRLRDQPQKPPNASPPAAGSGRQPRCCGWSVDTAALRRASLPPERGCVPSSGPTAESSNRKPARPSVAVWREHATSAAKPGNARRLAALLLAACGLLIGSFSAQAVSARKLIQQGNAAYQSGKFEEALSAYDEASVDAPESPEIYYNRGAVFYRQEDYEQAKAAFEKAALKSVEPILESRAHYNLGNCAFREAERQRDSDLQKAFESCEAAIRRYQDALRRNKDLTRAAENIEIVRLYMKALLDEIEKQKKEQEEQQQQEEDLAKKLKELIERQAKVLADNVQIVAKTRQPNAAQQQQEIALGMEDLTKEQASIQTDSEAVSNSVQETINQHAQQAQQAMPPMPGATNQPPAAAQSQQLDDKMLEKLGKVKEHVDNAVGQQKEANRKLPLRQLPQAQPHQRVSEEELKKALEALQEQDQQQQQQQQQQQEGDEKDKDEENQEEQQRQQQQQGEQGEQNEQDDEEKEQQEQEMQAAKAEDILNEEKDQREQRQRRMPVRFRAVDKNW